MSITCQNCKKQVSEWSKNCTFCGAVLDKSQAAAPQASGETVSCPVCFNNYSAGTKYCPQDGTKLEKELASVSTCPACGAMYSHDVKFCTNDGTRLQPDSARGEDILEDTYGGYYKASLGKRFGASLLDSLLITLMSLPAAYCLIQASSSRHRYDYRDDSSSMYGLALLLYIGPLIYAMVKDGIGMGQSVGKKACDIMVVDLNVNRPCSKGKSFTRNFVSNLVVFIPYLMYAGTQSPMLALVFLLTCMIDPIMVLTRDDGRKIGDLAANTQVIDSQYYRR